MRKNLFLACVFFVCMRGYPQTIIQKDPVIAKMINEVDADSLKSYIHQLVGFGTRNTLSTQSDPKKGIGAARQWVLNKFNEFVKGSGGRMTAIVDTTTIQSDGRWINRPVLLGNVIATLKGADISDDRIFIVSGHLDTRRSNVMDSTQDAPGANDDGSGVAAVLECARIMSQHAFPASVIFVVVSGEEQGTLGAKFMAQKAKNENWNIEAVLNNDIMGGNNSNQTNIDANTSVRVFSEGLPAFELDKNALSIRSLGMENDGKSRQLARYIKETGERYVENLEVKLIYRSDRYLRGGDHLPYIQNGFTAVRITETNENYFHQHQDVRMENGVQYGDLADFIDFEYLRKNTALNLCNLSNLAKSTGMPQEVRIEVKDLTNYTLLNWKSPKYGKPKGYYVLIRETDWPFWQKKIFTSGTELRLPYSKDNYFFAVQSVSDDGNESLAVSPTPGK
jgi:hypothetical protein